MLEHVLIMNKSACLHCVSFANALLQYLHNLIVIKKMN